MNIKGDSQNPNLIIQNNKQEQNQQLRRLDMPESNETSMKPNKVSRIKLVYLKIA